MSAIAQLMATLDPVMTVASTTQLQPIVISGADRTKLVELWAPAKAEWRAVLAQLGYGDPGDTQTDQDAGSGGGQVVGDDDTQTDQTP